MANPPSYKDALEASVAGEARHATQLALAAINARPEISEREAKEALLRAAMDIEHTPDPPRMTDAEAEAFRRRQKGRNMAILLVLLGLSALFFAITIVKMTKF